MGGLRDLRAPRPLVPRMQLCRAGVEGPRPVRANRFSRDPALRDPFLATCPSRFCENPPEPVRPAARGPRCDFSPKSAPGFTDVGLTRFSMSARRRPSARSLHPRCVRIGAASSTGDQLRSRRKFPFHPGFSVLGNPIPKNPALRSGPAAFPSGRLIPDPASGRFPPPKFHPPLCSLVRRGRPLSGRVRGSPRRRNCLRRPPPGACPRRAACPGWLAFRSGTSAGTPPKSPCFLDLPGPRRYIAPETAIGPESAGKRRPGKQTR